MSRFVLPSRMKIRHKFFTISLNLTIQSEAGEDLFEVKCSSFRLRKTVFIYSSGKERDLLLCVSPVWGLTGDVMVSRPDEEIVGVLQRAGEGKGVIWMAVDFRVVSCRSFATARPRFRTRSPLLGKKRAVAGG